MKGCCSTVVMSHHNIASGGSHSGPGGLGDDKVSGVDGDRLCGIVRFVDAHQPVCDRDFHSVRIA